MYMYIGLTVVYIKECVTSSTFKAIYGRNNMSVKPSMTVINMRSRIQCAASCQERDECRGFNFKTVSPGLVECDLKRGGTDNSTIQTQDGVTYYENTGKVKWSKHIPRILWKKHLSTR